MKQKLIAFVIWLIVFIWICLIIKQFTQKQNECFDRLEVIKLRLQEIDTEKKQIDIDIKLLEKELVKLNNEEASLNSEALNLFNWFLWKPDKGKDLSKLITDEEWNFIWWIGNDPSPEPSLDKSSEWQPGQLTEDWTNQVMPTTTWNSSHEKFKSLANAYGLNPSAIREVENHYWITEGVILCITVAETSGGKFGAGENNIWNVWNTDSNPRGNSYSNLWASLDAIGRTLTNRYLGKKQTLWCLSNRHHCEEVNDNWARYATSSPETSGAREPNMVACLSQIYGTVDPSTFNIRNR